MTIITNEILIDEILNEEQLENVAGGTLEQTAADMNRFTNETGFRFYGDDSQQREQFRDILFRCGVKIKDHGGFFDQNEYYLLNKRGERVRAVDENYAIGYAIDRYIRKDFIC